MRNARAYAIAGVWFAAGLALQGCSDKSRINFYIIDLKQTTSEAIVGASYITADVIGGNSNSPCVDRLETASVEVGMLYPTSADFPVGESYGSQVTGYQVDYFYKDPADGRLKGPISGLTQASSNVSTFLSAPRPDSGLLQSGVVFGIVIVPFSVKAWSVGATCHGLAGFTGGRVTEMIARVTVHARDLYGKNHSDTGNMLIYLQDYPPFPIAPVPGGTVTSANSCWNATPFSHWSGHPACL